MNNRFPKALLESFAAVGIFSVAAINAVVLYYTAISVQKAMKILRPIIVAFYTISFVIRMLAEIIPEEVLNVNI